jgi:putative toxin-antitoxin system antitoxin component (TIGR02293 family)
VQAGVVEFHRFHDWVGVPVVFVHPGQHLFHLEARPHSGVDHVDEQRGQRFLGLTPVLVVRVPVAAREQAESSCWEVDAVASEARVLPGRDRYQLQGRERIDTGPTPVSVEQTTRLAVHWWARCDIEERDRVELSVATAVGDEASTFLAGVVDRFDLDIGADHSAGEREVGLLFERLAERPELLVLPVGVDDHLVDQLVDLITHQVGLYGPRVAQIDAIDTSTTYSMTNTRRFDTLWLDEGIMTTLTALLDHLYEGDVVDTADIARVSDTNPRSVTRWKAEEAAPRREAEERLLELRAVVDLARRVMRDNAARLWLRSPNPDLGYDKPLDLIAQGRYQRVIDLLLAIAEGVTG